MICTAIIQLDLDAPINSKILYTETQLNFTDRGCETKPNGCVQPNSDNLLNSCSILSLYENPSVN